MKFKAQAGDSVRGERDDDDTENLFKRILAHEKPAPSSGAFSNYEMSEEWKRALLRIRTAVLRGAGAGLTVKGGLQLLTICMRVVEKVYLKKKRDRKLSLKDAALDALLYSLFMGCLSGTYTAVDEGLAIFFGKERTSGWRALLAGAIAGQTIRILGSKERQYSLSTYILLRGLTLLVRIGNKPTSPAALRSLLAPTRFANGDTLLMCAAASQIMYSFVLAPKSLTPSYRRFLARQAGKDHTVWDALGVLEGGGGADAAFKLLAAAGLPSGDAGTCAHCRILHPGQSCLGHIVSYLPMGYYNAVRTYLPFYLVSTLLVQRLNLLRNPAKFLPKITTGVLYSSAFLTLYLAGAFAGTCLGHRVAGAGGGRVIASSVWLAGLATQVEKKNRRMELALYCAARAIEAGVRCWQGWGWLPGPAAHARVDVAMFAVGCAALAHCYSDRLGVHRDVFPPKNLAVLDFVFGNTGVDAGAITHVPTNQQLVMRVSQSFTKKLSWASLEDAVTHSLDATTASTGHGHDNHSHHGHDDHGHDHGHGHSVAATKAQSSSLTGTGTGSGLPPPGQPLGRSSSSTPAIFAAAPGSIGSIGALHGVSAGGVHSHHHHHHHGHHHSHSHGHAHGAPSPLSGHHAPPLPPASRLGSNFSDHQLLSGLGKVQHYHSSGGLAAAGLPSLPTTSIPTVPCALSKENPARPAEAEAPAPTPVPVPETPCVVHDTPQQQQVEEKTEKVEEVGASSSARTPPPQVVMPSEPLPQPEEVEVQASEPVDTAAAAVVGGDAAGPVAVAEEAPSVEEDLSTPIPSTPQTVVAPAASVEVKTKVTPAKSAAAAVRPVPREVASWRAVGGRGKK